MQRIELNAIWIVDRRGSQIAERRPQDVHARNDSELRDQREREHQAQQHMARCKNMRSAVSESAVEQRADEKDDSGDDSNPVQFSQRASDDITGEMRVGQHIGDVERRWRQHECEEDEPADPADERKQHEKAEEGHDMRIIAVGRSRPHIEDACNLKPRTWEFLNAGG